MLFVRAKLASSYGDIFRRRDSEQMEELSWDLVSFSNARNRGFLLHLTPRVSVFSHPPIFHPFSARRRATLPIRRPVLFVSSIHELCPYHPSFLSRALLCKSSRLLCFLFVFLSLLFSSHFIFSIFVFLPRYIMFAFIPSFFSSYLFSSPSLFFLSLVCSNFVR